MKVDCESFTAIRPPNLSNRSCKVPNYNFDFQCQFRVNSFKLHPSLLKIIVKRTIRAFQPCASCHNPVSIAQLMLSQPIWDNISGTEGVVN